MPEYVKAWQCIGCGKIEAPQTCVGICQDRKIELVYAHEHRAALAGAQAALHELRGLVRQLASTTPRVGEWERSYRALQQRARLALAQTASVTAECNDLQTIATAPNQPEQNAPTIAYEARDGG